MTTMIHAIRAEYLRYRALAEAALAQLDDPELTVAGDHDENSVAVIVQHIAGNLRSRFTDFLTSDGEKPWRQREEEFRRRPVTRAALMQAWDEGWRTLLDTLGTLDVEQLSATVTIRQQPLTIGEALLRSLAHLSYHVGQIVFLARAIRGGSWQFLSIPPGQSERYNEAAGLETPAAHADRLARRTDETPS